MTEQQELRIFVIPPVLVKRVLFGMVLGFVLMSAFLISGGEGDPNWAPTWWLRPIVFEPLAGGVAGALFHVLSPMRKRGGLLAAVAIFLSILGYFVALWIGSVLGLVGTYWN